MPSDERLFIGIQEARVKFEEASNLVVLLCGTQRGLKCLQKLTELPLPTDVTVVTYPEFAGEPPFSDEIGAIATANNFRFFCQTKLTQGELGNLLRSGFDVLLAVSWRYLVPESIYSRARTGAYVFHDSLLPAYRGFSPTIWALINGEQETGVSLFEMAHSVDSGRIIEQRSLPIQDSDDIGTLRKKGTALLLDILEARWSDLLMASYVSRSQNEELATYACKWIPSDAKIDWTSTTRDIFNLVRATTSPYPGAFCQLGNTKLTIWRAAIPDKVPVYKSRVPGRVVGFDSTGAMVLTGDSLLMVQEVSVDGECNRVPASNVLNSYSITLT